MTTSDFTLTLLTDQTPEKVFQAMTNVRGWWTGYYSEEFEGNTEKLNDEFTFRAGGGLHYSKQQLVEVIPNKKVVWLITDSELSFIEEKDEWTGTKVIFEISQKEDGKTQLVFTHQGLAPEVECYESCAPAWTEYLQNKLLPLINSANKKETPDYTTTILVDKTPKQVFNAINNVRGWWSEEVVGGTDKLNDVFDYHYKDVHTCKIKIVELIPDKKVVWQVLDNHFNFTKDKNEWIGTKMIFEISEKDNKTQLQFTHQGLVPEYECYSICFDSWDNYIKLSLRDLIVSGKGLPNPKEQEREFNEQLLKQHGVQ